MKIELIIMVIGLFISMSSVLFTLLTYKKNERYDDKKEGKNEGIILSDISYIKASIDRVEKKIEKVDEQYQKVIERITKAESTLNNKNQVDKLCLKGEI